MRGIDWVLENVSHPPAGPFSISEWVNKASSFTISQTDSSVVFIVTIKRKADTIYTRVIAMFLPPFYKKSLYETFIGQSRVKSVFKIWKANWKYMLYVTKARRLVGFTQLPTPREPTVKRQRLETDYGLIFHATIKRNPRSKLQLEILTY